MIFYQFTPHNVTIMDMSESMVRRCTCPTCAEDLYDPPLHQKDSYRIRKIGQVQYSQHGFMEVVERAVSWIQQNPISLKQHTAQMRWKSYRLSIESQNLRSCTDLEKLEAKLLRTPFEIFNEIFFGGKIPSDVRISWSNCLGQGLAGIEANGGYFIKLNPRDARHRRWRAGVLCTLLHEMCHVFISLYSCWSCPECIGCEGHLLHDDNYGISGHGRAWQYLTKAIEDEAHRLIGWNVWLGREENATIEIQKGGWQPSACDWQRLFSDKSIVPKQWMWVASKDDFIVKSTMGMHLVAGTDWGRPDSIKELPRRKSMAGMRSNGDVA